MRFKMITDIKLKKIGLYDNVYHYVVDEMELNESVIQTYLEQDNRTIDILSDLYRTLFIHIRNAISGMEQGEEQLEYVRERMYDSIQDKTQHEINYWTYLRHKQLIAEEVKRPDGEEVLSSEELMEIAVYEAEQNFSDYTQFLRSAKPIEAEMIKNE